MLILRMRSRSWAWLQGLTPTTPLQRNHHDLSSVMAKIISQFPANVLIHTGVLETAGTILLCYGLAVGFGHVPAWLPMISDCAVQSPEKYPFRLGLVIGASLLALEVLCVYMADKSYSRNKFCLVVGVAASTGLGIVGVVNEKECDPVHSSKHSLYKCGVYHSNFLRGRTG